jgi:hypothetical protein
MLPVFVPVLFAFNTQGLLKFKCQILVPKKLISPSSGLVQVGQQENADMPFCCGVCIAKMWQFGVTFEGSKASLNALF